jgi:alpha-glucosidase
VAWDESRLVGGRPGEVATVARRAGGRWFVGSITAGGPRTVRVPLDFLGGGRYVAEIYRDAGDDDLARDRRLVTKRETLTVPVAQNGGFAVAIGRR